MFRHPTQVHFPAELLRNADLHLLARISERYYIAGREAFYSGVDRKDNPCKPPSAAYVYWYEGHSDAEREKRNRFL